MVDAAELLHARKYVDQGLAGSRDIEQRVALRGLLAQASSYQHDEVGSFHARQQLGIGADAEVTGITGMQGIEEMGAPERGCDRQREFFGKAREGGAGGL